MPDSGPRSRTSLNGKIHVELTEQPLQIEACMARVRSSAAGAMVMFAGTTRDNFEGKPVKELQYSSYEALALKTMFDIAEKAYKKHSLTAISIIHRLGTVPIGEESILIFVSSAHRKEAWRAGEEALEETKDRAEIWKLEEFGGEEGGVWRANRDGQAGVKVNDGSLRTINPDR